MISKLLILIVLGCGSFATCYWYKQASDKNFTIEKCSPNKTYCAKIEGKGILKNKLPHQLVNLQVLENNNLIFNADSFYEADEYEINFLSLYPKVEWIDDSTLYLGHESSNQPFRDQIIVSNNSEERINNLSISYGKRQMLLVFNVLPKSQITLYASPEFRRLEPRESYVIYRGNTQSGRSFGDITKEFQKNNTEDGPLTFLINADIK